MYSLLNIFYSARNSVPRLTHYENVRWFRRPRKPFWLGIAPSKKFVVKEPKELPKNENDELERLKYLYDRQYRSLTAFMSGSNICGLVGYYNEINLENTIMRSLAKNNAWNKKSNTLRKEREKKEVEEMENHLMKQAEQLKQKEELKKMDIDAIIDYELSVCETYVTEENLDVFIDKCLESVVEYNYAIDLNGNIYKGESLAPEGKLGSAKV